METNRTWLESLFLERNVEYRTGKTVTAAPSPALDMQVAMTQPNCGRNDTAIHSRMNLMKNKLLNAVGIITRTNSNAPGEQNSERRDDVLEKILNSYLRKTVFWKTIFWMGVSDSKDSLPKNSLAQVE